MVPDYLHFTCSHTCSQSVSGKATCSGVLTRLPGLAGTIFVLWNCCVMFVCPHHSFLMDIYYTCNEIKPSEIWVPGQGPCITLFAQYWETRAYWKPDKSGQCHYKVCFTVWFQDELWQWALTGLMVHADRSDNVIHISSPERNHINSYWDSNGLWVRHMGAVWKSYAAYTQKYQQQESLFLK